MLICDSGSKLTPELVRVVNVVQADRAAEVWNENARPPVRTTLSGILLSVCAISRGSLMCRKRIRACHRMGSAHTAPRLLFGPIAVPNADQKQRLSGRVRSAKSLRMLVGVSAGLVGVVLVGLLDWHTGKEISVS